MKTVLITILCYSIFSVFVFFLSDVNVIDDHLAVQICGGPILWIINLFFLCFQFIQKMRRKNMTDEQRKSYNEKCNVKQQARQKKHREKQEKYWTVERQTNIAKKYFSAFVQHSQKSGYLPAFNISSFLNHGFSSSDFDALGELPGVSQKLQQKFEKAYYTNKEQMKEIICSMSREYTKDDYTSDFSKPLSFLDAIKNVRVVVL